ncbi:hypothetical protein HMPREF9701_02105 [Delftia acidovorans CCUG 274B]|nr:hypothetical protein HMPREF9701_02105 [Delftia acidovorans CCUG 274B]
MAWTLAQGATTQTARKWLGRSGRCVFQASSLRAIDESKALLIVELRRRRMLQSRISSYAVVSVSTVSHLLNQ